MKELFLYFEKFNKTSYFLLFATWPATPATFSFSVSKYSFISNSVSFLGAVVVVVVVKELQRSVITDASAEEDAF